MKAYLALVLSLSAFAASDPPVARVIGSEPVVVDGIVSPAANYVPVGMGGKVATQRGSAVIQFVDGTSVTLQPNSQVNIEGQRAKPSVRIVRGSAEYRVTPASRVSVSSGDQMVTSILDNATSSVRAITNPNGQVAQAVMYRGSSASVGSALPSAIVYGGSFAMANLGTMSFSPGAGGSGPALFTPNGLTINLAPVTNSSGQITGYTVTSITETVVQPNGTSVQVTATTGSLIGATVSGISSNTSSGQTVAVQFTPQGSTTPLTSTQVTNTVQTTVQTAVNQGVQNGTIQSGTTATTTPVTTTTFSSSAP